MTRIYRRGEEKRQTLEVQYEQGLSYGEIAKATGIPVNNQIIGTAREKDRRMPSTRG